MWMMGCNDGGDQLCSVQDPLNGRKLRPSMPITAAATTSTAHSHGTDRFLALNHHFVIAEQNKKEFSTQQVVVSSRWNPTPDQLQTLEELYRRGVRTPSAEQIQHITAQLRRYGKIEGKNVFYWFQNHKARERQKRRRQLDQEPHNVNQIPNLERKKQSSAGENGTVFEVEQTYKKLASPKKSTATIALKNMPRRGAEGNKADGWVQYNEETELALEERRNPSIWQMLHLSSSSSSSASPNNLFNSSSATVDTNPLNHHHFPSLHEQCGGAAGGGCVEEHTKTLQLFPVRSGGRRPCEEEEEEEEDQSTVAPDYQFFEFLPLKK
ncbi:uncharacterized protein LOC142549370 [Primulina tabacum]|uniref:uncharacterized protein LOC142549370 n=1 Tax=Primulina tabacum TaxID=48773 RepID=UPI003F5A98FF